jgi:hypothetical protein
MGTLKYAAAAVCAAALTSAALGYERVYRIECISWTASAKRSTKANISWSI